MADKLKSYAVPWHGQLILACRKCQKKLKGNPDLRALAKLKKTIKRHNKEHPDKMLHVINVPCMSMCPKDGVTICNPAQQPVYLSVLRGEEDVEEVYCGL
jgi:predicted metal-binding protein